MPPKLEFNNSDYWSDPNTTSKYSFADGTTGPPCLLLLQQAGLAPSTGKEDLVIIDQACGGGITSQILWETLGDEGKRIATLKCGDFSEGMVASAKSRMDRLGWGQKGSAEVIDAMDTKLPSDHFTHVIMNFGINAVPDSDAALKGHSRPSLMHFS
jgi:ubiquinone/menaquinone biosynthesis C-methylase UbiE